MKRGVYIQPKIKFQDLRSRCYRTICSASQNSFNPDEIAIDDTYEHAFD